MLTFKPLGSLWTGVSDDFSWGDHPLVSRPGRERRSYSLVGLFLNRGLYGGLKKVRTLAIVNPCGRFWLGMGSNLVSKCRVFLRTGQRGSVGLARLKMHGLPNYKPSNFVVLIPTFIALKPLCLRLTEIRTAGLLNLPIDSGAWGGKWPVFLGLWFLLLVVTLLVLALLAVFVHFRHFFTLSICAGSPRSFGWYRNSSVVRPWSACLGLLLLRLLRNTMSVKLVFVA